MEWIKSEKQVKDFVNEPNQKHPSTKFNYKLDCKRIEFLDTLVYIDQQNKLQTTQVIVKTFLMQNRNIYSQALQIRRICSTFQGYHSHSGKLIEQLVNKGYKKDVLKPQIQNVDQLDRKQLLHQ